MRARITHAVDEHARRLFAEGRVSSIYAREPFGRHLASLYAERDMGLRSWDSIVFGPELYDLIAHPGIVDALEPLLGPEISFNGGFRLRPKLPCNQLTAFPLHQDSQYYGKPSQHTHIVTVWIPLADVDEVNGCLYVIPGSHQWGLLDSTRDENRNMRTFEDVEKRATPVPVPMKIGDILLFSNMTFHGSRINRSNAVRWSLDIRYISTPCSRPMSAREQEALEYMYNNLNKLRRPVPLVVRGSKKKPTFEQWQAECQALLSG